MAGIARGARAEHLVSVTLKPSRGMRVRPSLHVAAHAEILLVARLTCTSGLKRRLLVVLPPTG